MARYAILTDLDRCVGCLACMTGCKMQNDVEIGSYWTRIVRVGPTPLYEGAVSPDVEMYYLPVGCQHCANPECVSVCPTGASQKMDDGTIQIDKDLCIGCELCVSACPYGVRYLNQTEGIVEKCTLCKERIDEGELPQCVVNCGGRARFFGDLDKGIDSFEAYAPAGDAEFQGRSYDDMCATRVTYGEYCKPYTEDQVHTLPNSGNDPSFVYVLRQAQWQEGDNLNLEPFQIAPHI